MDYSQLVAKQALRIEHQIQIMRKQQATIQGVLNLLVCIGGPMNDGHVTYSKKQRVLLHKIYNLVR
jgi:hypothetical protein